MPYVQRDSTGQVVALFAEAGPGHDEELPAGHPDAAALAGSGEFARLGIPPPLPPQTEESFVAHAVGLCGRVGLPPRTRYRLVGVGLANFVNPSETEQQSVLF